MSSLRSLAVISTRCAALQAHQPRHADHKIRISGAAARRTGADQPSQTVDGFCKTGCTMKMADGEEYEFDGNEVVSIEEGLMFLDDPRPTGSAAESQKQ